MTMHDPAHYAARLQRIADLLSDGMSDKEIGRELDMTDKAVEQQIIKLRARYGPLNRCRLMLVILRDAGRLTEPPRETCPQTCANESSPAAPSMMALSDAICVVWYPPQGAPLPRS